MLEQLEPRVRGVILDMDGVLWKDTAPIGNLPVVFSLIHALDLKVFLATNNATMTVDEYRMKLQGFGVAVHPEQIITSADAVADALTKAFPRKGAVFVVGESGVVEALREDGFLTITDADDDSPVVAVVAGLDRRLTYDKLRRATFHIRGGARFYGTNPDATFPTPEGLVPGAGSVLAALETAGERKAIVLGKPAAYMFELALERMNMGRDEVLIVGDRLETDIAGGQSLGARTALVLSGVSTSAQAGAWKPSPDLIVKDLAELFCA